MFKKLMLPVLIISIVVQLFVPVGMIAYGNKAEEDLQKYGKEFKFQANIHYIQKGKVNFSLIDMGVLYQEGMYGVVKENTDGYALIVETTAGKPKGHDYIRINEENREKMDTFFVNREYAYRNVTGESAYLVVKVYNGEVEVVEMYIDGVTAEEWFKTKL